jgi:hypothetical protein
MSRHQGSLFVPGTTFSRTLFMVNRFHVPSHNRHGSLLDLPARTETNGRRVRSSIQNSVVEVILYCGAHVGDSGKVCQHVLLPIREGAFVGSVLCWCLWPSTSVKIAFRGPELSVAIAALATLHLNAVSGVAAARLFRFNKRAAAKIWVRRTGAESFR